MNRTLLIIFLVLKSTMIFSQTNSHSDDIFLEVLNRSIDNKDPDTIIIMRQDYLPLNIPQTIKGHKILFLAKEEFSKYQNRPVSVKEIHPISVNDDILEILVGQFVFSESEAILDYVGSYRVKFKFNCRKKKFLYYGKDFLGF